MSASMIRTVIGMTNDLPAVSFFTDHCDDIVMNERADKIEKKPWDAWIVKKLKKSASKIKEELLSKKRSEVVERDLNKINDSQKLISHLSIMLERCGFDCGDYFFDVSIIISVLEEVYIMLNARYFDQETIESSEINDLYSLLSEICKKAGADILRVFGGSV